MMDALLDEMFYELLEFEIATENELNLVISINGYNEETMRSIMYARAGKRTFDFEEE